MSQRVYGVAATISGTIFTIIISVYSEPIRKYISNLLGVPDETIVLFGLIIIAITWILAGILLLANSRALDRHTHET